MIFRITPQCAADEIQPGSGIPAHEIASLYISIIVGRSPPGKSGAHAAACKFESAAIQRSAAATFPAGNAGAAATLPKACANTVAAAILSATDKA